MRRTLFVKRLLRAGCVLVRHGGRHDIYYNPQTGKRQPVPRHTELEDCLVRHIRKQLGIEK